jgi:hypothetical protein
MPETDVLTRRLREIGALDARELPAESLLTTVQLAVKAEIERERLGSGRPSRRRRANIRVNRGALVSTVCVLVALAVVAGALVFISGGSGGSDQTAATPGANGLIARLAVLRRPQTPADRLPAHLHLVASFGTIVPGLTRRIEVQKGLQLYLVVRTPAPAVRRTYTYPSLVWPARLGDQVSLIAVGHTGATQNAGFPAVNLDNAAQLSVLGRAAIAGHSGGPVRVAQIVPDGVARVRWHYAARPHGFAPIQTTTVTDNVALAPARRATPRSATWLAASGAVIPTSAAAARRVVAEAQHRNARAIIAQLELTHAVATPALLHGFALFNGGARSSLTRDGVTVTRPRLADVPASVLDTVLRDVATTKLEPSQIRQVKARSGPRFWVIPGASGLCAVFPGPAMTIELTPQLPGDVGGASGYTSICSSSVASALTRGVGETGGGSGGSIRYAAGVLPRAHPATIVPARGGHRRTIRPPLGVYFVQIPPG